MDKQSRSDSHSSRYYEKKLKKYKKMMRKYRKQNHSEQSTGTPGSTSGRRRGSTSSLSSSSSSRSPSRSPSPRSHDQSSWPENLLPTASIIKDFRAAIAEANKNSLTPLKKPAQAPSCFSTPAKRLAHANDSSTTSVNATFSSADVTLPLEPDCIIDLVSTDNAPKQADENAVPKLPSSILKFLDPTSKKKTYGVNIQEDVAALLQKIATKGLDKEARSELMNKHLVPQNCTLIDAPALNNYFQSPTFKMLPDEDKRTELKQKQLASAISCIAEALTKLLANPVDEFLIELLMDAAKLLCDSQKDISDSRRNYILKRQPKEFKAVLQDTNINELLFSEKPPDEPQVL